MFNSDYIMNSLTHSYTLYAQQTTPPEPPASPSSPSEKKRQADNKQKFLSQTLKQTSFHTNAANVSNIRNIANSGRGNGAGTAARPTSK